MVSSARQPIETDWVVSTWDSRWQLELASLRLQLRLPLAEASESPVPSACAAAAPFPESEAVFWPTEASAQACSLPPAAASATPGEQNVPAQGSPEQVG